MKKIVMLLILVLSIVGLTACGDGGDKPSNAQKSNQHAREAAAKANQEFKAPEIKNDVEYQNYYNAQKLYDSPTTIIWCTTTWGNANSPLVTVPVTGKLTSSSVSLFPSTQTVIDTDTYGRTYNPELTSVDGMYHGSPPPYRYGFTPGGQYVDFFNMPTFCTTALTKMQRQSSTVTVEVDDQMAAAQKIAEAALTKCTANVTKSRPDEKRSCPDAQKALEAVLGGDK